MHVTDDDMDAVHNYIVAAEAGDRAALAYGDYDLGKPRMIVTSSFAERWTDNPDHYRESFGIDDVEVLDEKRPLEDDEFQSWHDDPGYY